MKKANTTSSDLPVQQAGQKAMQLPGMEPGDRLANRRCFLAMLATASAALALAPLPFAKKFIFDEAEGFPKLELTGAGELAPGEATTFAYPEKDDPALLVRLNNSEYRAYAGTCTHLGCLVHWDVYSGQLVCPCHSGVFSAEDGAVLSGPPPIALPQIKLQDVDGVIYAVGMAT